MRKKLLTLLTLLVCVCSGAWAASVNDLVAISSDYTFIADNITSNGTVKLTKNTLYDNSRIFAPTANTVATNKGTHATFDDGTHLNSLRLKNTQDQLVFKVAGPCKVIFYTQSHSSRGIQVGSTAGGTEYGSQTASTTEWECNITSAGLVYLSSYGSDFYFAGFTVTGFVTATSEALKSSAAVKVDDAALTLDDAADGYTVDGTTITLGSNITFVAAPTNIELVKTVTFSDESTKDQDVTVTFDGTITDGYYIGTASIGLTGSETAYTVKAKQATQPTLVLSETSASLTGLKSYQVGSTTVTLTGANLTDGTYDVAAEGLTITPTSFTVADGVVNQEFTITGSASTAAETEINFTAGTATATFTLTYSQAAKRDVERVDVTETTTWDWTTLDCEAVELKNDGTTDPSSSKEFLMASLPELTNSDAFNSQALTIVAQFPYRGSSNEYLQGNSVKFTTTVAGTVQVWFSNTGTRADEEANRRYLYINGTSTDVYSLNTTMVEASADVEAGEVVINAYMGVTDPSATMVRINKIVFTYSSTLTGIQTVKTAEQENDVIYNLAGQRIAKPAKGLYIQNGKKMMVK